MQQKQPWKGYAILGSGNLTAVYSDDSRITAATHATGVQHLYYRDYSADYVASTSFDVMQHATAAPEVGMRNFFTTETKAASARVRCFVSPGDAVVLAVEGSGPNGYRFTAELRKEMHTDTTIALTSLRATGSAAIASWSNGAVLVVAPQAESDEVATNGSSVVVTGNSANAEVLLIPGSSPREALGRLRELRSKNLNETASRYWEFWMNSGILPKLAANQPDSAALLEAYKRNLYCVKAATLNGQIPADITGQFVTNNMPQLYPRDAMMCARVLLLCGHADEARDVIRFWAGGRIPMKTPGEWYARYDAHGKAVDAGSGARFDEPEWDANGYFIYLVDRYHKMTGHWPVDKALIYPFADFLVHHLSENGLLEEGGIVEWTGYLPATNMICSAALKTAAAIAHQAGDEPRANQYSAASARIASSLPRMFDPDRQTFADVRSIARKGANNESLKGEGGRRIYLWDTTANVGVIWGYPNHREIELSNRFYAQNTVKLGGGMQYFDSPDPGLAAYGHAVFFFTTAAASQYESIRGNKAAAKSFLDWMLRNANSYGLMPERILPDGSDCSPASPLSWCSAEFAAALLAWSRI